jgi:hypothetical protein
MDFLGETPPLEPDNATVARKQSNPDTTCCPCLASSVTKFAHADRPYDYGSGQLMIGTELMLFLGLPSITLSL